MIKTYIRFSLFSAAIGPTLQITTIEQNRLDLIVYSVNATQF